MNFFSRQLLVLIVLMFSLSVFSQEISDGDLEVEDAAFENLQMENYKEAAELFSQLMSLYPSNSSYNLYYAKCLIEQNKEITNAIKFLNRAKKGNEEPELNYYFGRAYHLSYEFDKAVEYYQKFSTEIGVKIANNDYNIEHEIRMANNGKELIKYISDLTVVENKHIKASNYYYSYKLDDFGGKLVVKSPDFMSKKDKKSGEKQLMFMSDSGYVYYSSYGKKAENGLDIYRAYKNNDGTWGESQKLSLAINTPYNDSYPYLHSDGKTLYFSSKGHNTMGGYDVFKTVFDSVNNKWEQPVNMDFPTNTPYDDYLYISDKNEDYAYFTSNRETTGDKISVYKVLVDKNPIRKEYDDIDMILIKSKLKISSPEDINKTKARNKQNKQLLASSNRKDIKVEEFNYNFEKLLIDDIKSTEEVVTENEKDVVRIEKVLAESKLNSEKALEYSYKKNTEADNVRKRANEILSQKDLSETETERAEDLMETADYLEQEAVLFHNILNVLEADNKQKSTDIELTKMLSNNLKTSTDINKSVEELNLNRESLQKGKGKYFDINEEIEERNIVVSDKQKMLTIIDDKIVKIKNEIENNNATIKDINESNNSDKETSVNSIKDKNKALDIQFKELNSQKELASVEIDIKNREIVSLKEVSTYFAENNKADKTLLAEINTEEFSKVIEAKSFSSETKQKQLTVKRQTEAKEKTLLVAEIEEAGLNNNNSIAVNTSKIENSATKVNIEEEPETEIDNVDAGTKAATINAQGKQATNSEVVKLRTDAEKNNNVVDSLNTLIAEKEKAKQETTDKSKVASLDNDIESLSFVVAIKQKQALRQTKEADALENVYLAEAKPEIEKNNETVINIINTNSELELMQKQQNKNKVITDSLISLSEEKQRLADNQDNEDKRNLLIDEADELAQLAEIKQNQIGINAVKINKKQNELNTLVTVSETNIETDNSLPFNKTAANTNVEKYKRELLKKTYYQNKNADLQTKLKSYNSSSDNITEEVAKADVENNIAVLNIEIEKNNARIIIAETNANKYKKQIGEGISVEETTEEKLYADATSYKITNEKILNDNKKEIEEIKASEQKIQDLKIDWKLVNVEINDLEKRISLTDDDKQKKELNKLLKTKKAEASIDFNKYDEKNTALNYTLHKALTNLIETYKTEGNTKEEKEAIALVKQSDLYFDEANTLRNSDNEDVNVSEKERMQALNLEQISINKQKNALDIYANIKPEVAQVKNNNTVPVLVLTADDQSDLKNYRKLSFKAEKKKTSSNRNLEELSIKQRNANRMYSKDKESIVAELKEEELEISSSLIQSYNSVSVADSLKYYVYKKQLAEISTNNNITKQNRLVANEYIKGADYFYSEAKNIQEQASSETDVIKKRKQLEKAYSLQQMALQNQEIAVNTLFNKNEDDFVSSGSLVKLEPLEQYDTKIDVKDVEFATYDKIIEQLSLTDDELKSLDKLVDAEADIDDEETVYEEIESDILFLNNDLADSDGEKEHAKIKKNIEKKEAELISSEFAILDYKEKYNDTKFYVLHDNLKANRKKGSTNEVLQARQLAKDAAKDYKRAKSLREKSFMVETNEKALDYNNEAVLLEEKAISNLTKAYSLYLNIDETEIEQQLAENKTQETEKLGIINKTTANISSVETVAVVPVVVPVVANVSNNEEDDKEEDLELTNEKQTTNTDSLNTDVLVAETVVLEEDTINKIIDYGNEVLVAENVADNSNSNIEQVEEDIEPEVVNITENEIKTEKILVDNNLPKQLNYAVYPVSVYTKTNPIPLNPELPEGVVFKVQVGAFKRAIRQDAFNGLSPIAAEKIPGSSYTRYLAGMFKSYEGVRTALTEIKTIGYKDAFIVAYRNGKRIPLYVAKGEAKENIANYSDVASTESANVKSRNKNALDLASSNSTSTVNNTSTETRNVVVAKNIKKTNKLLYTVQIGVYKKPVSHSRLYNLSPIYEEQTAYGFIRYATGVFSDRASATAEKNRIRKIGIKDAFVTAYYKGEKISLKKAASLKTSNVETESNESVSLPQVKVSNTATSSVNAANLYYKVQIGAYKEQIPVNDVTSWLSLARKQDLKQFKDERGYTIFAVGNYKSYNEASRMKSILINEGVKDAFIVAYSGNKKVSVVKAKELLGQ